MILENPGTWQMRRSDFNHQWLKNQFLSALDCAANYFSGKLRGEGYLEEFFSSDFRSWESKTTEGRRLIDDFEIDMTPRILFESEPLCGWDEALFQAGSLAIHELWLARNRVRSIAGHAHDCLNAADGAYHILSQVIKEECSDFRSQEVRNCFEIFRSSCRILSESVEMFPSRLLVV
jgi:hypothetical protein